MVNFGVLLGFMFTILGISTLVVLKSYKNFPEPVEPSAHGGESHIEEPVEAPELIVLNPTMEEVD